MNSKRVLKEFIEALDDISAITRVFEHVASRKMEINKTEVERVNRRLIEERESYSYAKISLAGARRDRETILQTAYRVPVKKKIILLVSSESRYAGVLIDSMVRQFILEFNRGGADGIVIGDVGRMLLKKYRFNSENVSYFNFDDDRPNWNVVSQVSERISKYLEVVVYWGKFKSILTQELEREDLAKSVAVEDVPKVRRYEIEEKRSQVLAALEKQIITSAFMEKLLEAGLTKYAVRVKLLEIGAIAERINAAYEQIAKYKVRLTKDITNRKQTQLYGARSTWERKGVFSIGR